MVSLLQLRFCRLPQHLYPYLLHLLCMVCFNSHFYVTENSAIPDKGNVTQQYKVLCEPTMPSLFCTFSMFFI